MRWKLLSVVVGCVLGPLCGGSTFGGKAPATGNENPCLFNAVVLSERFSNGNIPSWRAHIVYDEKSECFVMMQVVKGLCWAYFPWNQRPDPNALVKIQKLKDKELSVWEFLQAFPGQELSPFHHLDKSDKFDKFLEALRMPSAIAALTGGSLVSELGWTVEEKKGDEWHLFVDDSGKLGAFGFRSRKLGFDHFESKFHAAVEAHLARGKARLARESDANGQESDDSDDDWQPFLAEAVEDDKGKLFLLLVGSDAPRISVKGLGLRLDVEFSSLGKALWACWKMWAFPINLVIRVDDRDGGCIMVGDEGVAVFTPDSDTCSAVRDREGLAFNEKFAFQHGLRKQLEASLGALPVIADAQLETLFDDYVSSLR